MIQLLTKFPQENRMLQQLLVFTGCSSIHFLIHLLPLTQSVRLPLLLYQSLCSKCVTHGLLHSITGHQGKYFPSNPYLEKQRISLGVASILSMRLCPHTQLNCNQMLLDGRFYLYINFCYKLLYQLLTGYEPTFKQFHIELFNRTI